MKTIFLSYRTDDSVHATMAISDRLAGHFGRERVFRDHDSLRVGTLYPRRIRSALERSDVVLAVIGPRWLESRDGRDRRRIDDPRDWVRVELRMAFRQEIPVVPVLLDGTPLPAREQLPEDLGLLPLSTFHQVRHQSWAADLQALVEKLDPDATVPPPAGASNVQHTTVGGNGVAYVSQNGSQVIKTHGRDGARG
ncbi:toll/interleukin-1 receptor domain-containing protein [Actinophytocola gossypii]|uniref:Toll/interleukin-1 receptor domain-containing protein n=1 Tax=Actinophytocola gossypii TaxID=2812003 RepID=A0ABT2JK92_9PSEU|nr:toll/interleukin-1 receptor domain-containing protein [Actinophytocola gossypii]MCT2588276.1 toll/interleukin-1 receptor domain-containing protein [Actinophytocola gossypii]